MNRKAIEQKAYVKYLGVLVDKHIKWAPQVAAVSRRIGRGIGVLAKLRSFLDVKLLTNIYYSLVYSHLSYGVQVWGSACPSELLKINTLQNKAARIMTGNRYYQIYGEPTGPLPSAGPLFKSLAILEFGDIFRLNIAAFIYLTLEEETPQNFHGWFQYGNDIHSHAVRSNTQIIQDDHFDVGTEVPTTNLRPVRSHLVHYGDKLIRVSGPLIWNGLPGDIRECTSIFTFKDHLKKYFISQYS